MHKAALYQQYENKKITCKLCAHYCNLSENAIGVCGVRKNIGGDLFLLNYGKISSVAMDPIEKKPFYHYMPGSSILSFGLEGCNFKCSCCQNFDLSQNIKKNGPSDNYKLFTPDDIMNMAMKYHADGIAYTYSEPTIFYEFANDVIKRCKSDAKFRHIKHLFISNGYQSKELRELIISEKLIDAINIDLKFMNDSKYKHITGGTLDPVLENISEFYRAGIHLEVINLIVPGENDTDDDIGDLISFIKSVSSDIPLHFSRFYPHYKMADKLPTASEILIKARNKAIESGLNYVYIGNLNVDGASDTICKHCNEVLIKRNYYSVEIKNLLNKNDSYLCAKCGGENSIRK